MRREWIEMQLLLTENQHCNRSPSMRREWIEILSKCANLVDIDVSLHAEGVD